MNESFCWIPGCKVREPETEIPDAVGTTIGDLLKRKAEEGVAVRLMLWDDETSLPIIHNPGLMRTHDEDALRYFNHSKVVCCLCPRTHHKFPTFFAHHQKAITVDTQPREPTGCIREITSFVGGFDLCDGRYDTEQHSLFRTLNTPSHARDFYQINFEGASLQRGGPREPWHDSHARVTGQAAWDILTNFEQRWNKQLDPALLPSTDKIPNLSRPSPISGDWNVQVFRSIDHVSVSSSHLVECSIHAAYVAAIRRAERFIYVENQYFMGGCHMWEEDRRCGCGNLVPVEIAMKVASKIRTGERFGAYIVVPMWPEGVPETEVVQEMLHWTRMTMATMYRLVGEATRERGEPGAQPRDYLNFFCLGNREKAVEEAGELVPSCSPPHSSNYWRAQQHRRFMVYVHSKVMIVDDEYILIGSANVNQRSMDGRRDTEIAMGCYQPQFTGRERSTSGEIHRYRMSLWYEHTRLAEQVFREPESVECVRRMVDIGDKMWSLYREEAEIVDMEGVHLVSYPMKVTREGRIEEVEEGGMFPDTTALVRGKRSKLLPPIFTT